MGANKTTLLTTADNWNSKRRYKVNSVVTYLGKEFQNKTGANSIPTDFVDWELSSISTTDSNVINVVGGFQTARASDGKAIYVFDDVSGIGTLSIATNAVEPIKIGSKIQTVYKKTTSSLTVLALAGVTVYAKSGLSAGSFEMITLEKVGNDEWMLSRDSDTVTNSLEEIENFNNIAYTLNVANINKRTVFSSANPIALTVPTNVSEALPIGTIKKITQSNTGVITIGGAGITFVTNLDLFMTEGESRILTKVNTDTWVVTAGNFNKPTLQAVTDYGNSTTNPITVQGIEIKNNNATSTQIGVNSGSTAGSGQIAIGLNAGQGNLGNNEIAIGANSGKNNNGANSTFIGANSGENNTQGDATFIGYQSGTGNTGVRSTALGTQSSRNNSGTNQTALGYNAGGEIASVPNSGTFQTAIGSGAGAANTGNNQTAVGYNAGPSNSGLDQTTVGVQSGVGNTKRGNTSVGYSSANSNNGERVSVIGWEAGRINEGDYVCGIGFRAAFDNNHSNTIHLSASSVFATADSPNQLVIKTAAGNIRIDTNETVDKKYSLPSVTNSKIASESPFQVISSVSGSIAVNMATGRNFDSSLADASNVTLSNPTNVVVGSTIMVRLTSVGTIGSFSFGSSYKFSGGVAPTITGTASSVDYLTFYVFSASEIVLTQSILNIS
jgi:hypothetical protein